MRVYRQGDTIRASVKLAYKGTGNPVNLSGCTAYSKMKQSPDGKLVAKGTPYINASQGTVTVEYTPQQTIEMEPGVYGFDIRMTSVWRVRRPNSGNSEIPTPVIQTVTDVVTLLTEQIRIVKPYTELE